MSGFLIVLAILWFFAAAAGVEWLADRCPRFAALLEAIVPGPTQGGGDR